MDREDPVKSLGFEYCENLLQWKKPSDAVTGSSMVKLCMVRSDEMLQLEKIEEMQACAEIYDRSSIAESIREDSFMMGIIGNDSTVSFYEVTPGLFVPEAVPRDITPSVDQKGKSVIPEEKDTS